MRTAIRKSARHLAEGLGGMALAGLAASAIVWANVGRIETAEGADCEARGELSQYAHVLEALDQQYIALRGYARTGDDRFLQSYEAHGRDIETAVAVLDAFGADDAPAMRWRIADIDRQWRAWMLAAARPAIAEARAGRRHPIDLQAGVAQMDAIRADIAFLRAGEGRVLAARDDEQRQAIRSTRLTVVIGSLLAGCFALLVGFRSFWQVIRARRQSELWAAELEDALDRANAAERAKTTFLANMSHEMRTPLNGVMGMADALSGTRLTVPQRGLLEELRISATTLDGLIGNLLAVSRGAAATDAVGPFRLGAAVREVVEAHRPQANLKGLTLGARIAPDADAEVVGDVASLRCLIGCLLSNAVKFTSRGRIFVSVARTAAGWRFEVADTGMGFDEARKAELFEVFGRSEDGATRTHGGAGVGLALAARVAVEMGGRLDARSTPGEGSVFSFEVDLPLAQAAEPDVVDPPVAERPACDHAEAPAPRILIVDDNATNRKVLELILEQLGVGWLSVENGREAVDAAANEDFAAILMDIQMPVMDGLTATREIRRRERETHHSQTPVIIVSANGQPEHVQAGRAAGAQAHLGKPVNPEQLVAALNDAWDEAA